MDKASELELFEYLSRTPAVRKWLEQKLDAEMKILVQALDVDQLRKAQGRAGLLDSMLRLLNDAPSAAKR